MDDLVLYQFCRDIAHQAGVILNAHCKYDPGR